MKRLALVAGILVIALVAAVVVRVVVIDDKDELVIVHWSNSHLTREGLLPEMADEFNDDDNRTGSGAQIRVVVLSCDSAVQAEDLTARATGGGRAKTECETDDGERAGDPTIVTPQSRDWLVGVNGAAGRPVVALDSTTDIARTWLGIVTYREMAECLGAPDKQLGYSDILQLKAEGWEAHADCADTTWGPPRLAFTNPNTSTSGRNVLVSLYAMANPSKTLDQLTVEDIERRDAVEFVQRFQGLVDHYQPGTIPLNTKVRQGPRFGQFFLMPEDNLVSLYRGKEKAIADDGTVQPLPAAKPGTFVMLYPKEGSVLNSHAAGVVDAPWVTPAHADAAEQWIEYLQDDDRQREFMDSGFRPSSTSTLKVDPAKFANWGLDAKEPEQRIEPGDLAPDVLDKIIASWGAVKNPAIVTFVVDTSGSMGQQLGDADVIPLDQVKEGLLRVIDAMSIVDRAGATDQVGLVTFSDQVSVALTPRPIAESKFAVANAIDGMTATGKTSLYDAVKAGIQLSDTAPGDARATRAVVVLSDGIATAGGCLSDIVAMQHSTREAAIAKFCPPKVDTERDEVVDVGGAQLSANEVRGIALRPAPAHAVQVFFLGFGSADVNIGRILAEATGAEFQGSTEQDLAAVIEELSGYF